MTNQIAAETATLPEQVKLYSSLLEHCTDLIHRVTPEGRFVYVNKAWRETLGYSDEEKIK